MEKQNKVKKRKDLIIKNNFVKASSKSNKNSEQFRNKKLSEMANIYDF
jgi:hypothetical protein